MISVSMSLRLLQTKPSSTKIKTIFSPPLDGGTRRSNLPHTCSTQISTWIRWIWHSWIQETVSTHQDFSSAGGQDAYYLGLKVPVVFPGRFLLPRSRIRTQFWCRTISFPNRFLSRLRKLVEVMNVWLLGRRFPCSRCNKFLCNPLRPGEPCCGEEHPSIHDIKNPFRLDSLSSWWELC